MLSAAEAPPRDAAAFAEFYAAEWPILHARLAKKVGKGQAEELCQEVFARAWQRWADVVACAAPRAWLNTVANRVLIDGWRREVTAVQSAPLLAGGQQHATEPSVDAVMVRAGMAQLSPAHQEVLKLFYFADLDVRALAEVTGISESAVKSRLRSARRVLATSLGLLPGADGEVVPLRPAPAPADERCA